MKKLALVLSAVFSCSAALAADLHIAPGETYTISSDQQRLNLNNLTIGDDARIVFAKGVEQWQLRADQARLGTNISIDGSGFAGESGVAGAAGDSVSRCEDGRAGINGGDGAAGGDGVSIRMQLGLLSFGDMAVTSNGGSGGKGGHGGDGSAAGAFEVGCKTAPTGGDAGAGGAGGDGGSAGDVTVLYWPANPNLDVSRIARLIRVEASSGDSGLPGEAGTPGAGSEGRYIKKKTLTGNRSWVAGGEAGAVAAHGKPGNPGQDGKILVEQALVSVVPAPVTSRQKPQTSGKTSSDKQTEIQAIKQELRSLLQRLDELETE